MRLSNFKRAIEAQEGFIKSVAADATSQRFLAVSMATPFPRSRQRLWSRQTSATLHRCRPRLVGTPQNNKYDFVIHLSDVNILQLNGPAGNVMSALFNLKVKNKLSATTFRLQYGTS